MPMLPSIGFDRPSAPTSLEGYGGVEQAKARLRQILAAQQQYPGRLPGGTGETGLQSTDSQGWSDMLNEQTEAGNIQNWLQGKPSLRVLSGGGESRYRTPKSIQALSGGGF